MTRQSDDCCGNCTFSRSALDQKGNVDLSAPRQCKLEPPKVFLVPQGPGTMGFAAVRASVAPGDWCSKHERKP